ncbi:hypothetical protein R3P38DRAFT_3294138 [Favolaschia claudopus]|uniref:Transposase n=1 Tax=Favolaschia claudopus TaxID=2862362 RepID=A0AAV9ZGF1_9AGAR
MSDSSCPYCGCIPETLQGLRSHISQSAACRRAHFNKYMAEDSSASEPDSPTSDDSDFQGMRVDAAVSGFSDGPFESEPFDFEENRDSEPPEDFAMPSITEPTGAAPSLTNPRKHPRPTVEEVDDEEDEFVQPFHPEYQAGAAFRDAQPFETEYEGIRREQQEKDLPPWAPFETREEWELAQWLMTSGISQGKMDELLKLKAVREKINPSYHNSRSFYQRIDALPRGPGWKCELFSLTGDEVDGKGRPKTEVVELWYRDPVECIKELLGNPLFKDQGYEPCRLFKKFVNEKLENRKFSEMWTADFWWEVQKLLPKGATLIPIILASDKTQLTRFSGDKQAWPVYITIGNIDKKTRRSPSYGATILLGYIPVPKLEIFIKKRRSAIAYQLYHDCMRKILATMVTAGNKGELMACADRYRRLGFPILAAYIADYPEQCLVCGCKENSCPECQCAPDARGDPESAPWRDPAETLEILRAQANGECPIEFVEQQLRSIEPFWADLPHANIFRSMTPDLLHESHNGAFGDHAVKWTTQAIAGGEAEIDQRFRAMTPHPSLRHFKKGISGVSQWTGRERKEMEKVYLGILADATDPEVLLAARAILDFIYYAHFETHCDESLAQLDAAWVSFHAHKHAFIRLGLRNHFNISKIHKLKHYVDSIRSRGTTDGTNSEATERLHIDLAKLGYRASNKKDYTQQMTVWLQRQEAVRKFKNYICWVDSESDSAACSSDSEESHTSSDSDAAVPPPRPPSSSPAFSLPKKPSFPAASAGTIARDFCAPRFVDKVADFLHDTFRIQAPIDESTKFAVFKRVKLQLPFLAEVASGDLRDTVRASKAVPAKTTSKGYRPEKGGTFDTVLVRTRPRANGAPPTDGLSVARVRVIFNIPSHIISQSPSCAYVDWFRPLQPLPADGIGMHKLSLSSRNHLQNSSVIPLSQILRSCHLIPRFGRAANKSWTSGTVLDEAKEFYLNPYLRHHDFHLFRFQYAVYVARKEEEARRVRMRVLGRAGR